MYIPTFNLFSFILVLIIPIILFHSCSHITNYSLSVSISYFQLFPIGLSVDESSLTGEQEPREKSPKALPSEIAYHSLPLSLSLSLYHSFSLFLSLFLSLSFTLSISLHISVFLSLLLSISLFFYSFRPDISEDADLSDRNNMTFMGSLVSSGHGLCIVTSIGLTTGSKSISHLIPR